MVYAQDVVVVLDELRVASVPSGRCLDFGKDGGDGGGLAGGREAGAMTGEDLGEGQAAAIGEGG